MAIQDNATRQLGVLPFGNLIGGPLVAAVEAQAKAARSTVDFIQSVAFTPDSNGETLQTVKFRYKTTENTETGDRKLADKMEELEVPLLVIVPIPYVRIDDMTIQFKANISAETSVADTTATAKTEDKNFNLSGKYGWGPAKVESGFSANYSSKKDSTATRDSKYSVEYTMDIYVHAVTEDMPKGMATVLNILNESIKGKEPAAKAT